MPTFENTVWVNNFQSSVMRPILKCRETQVICSVCLNFFLKPLLIIHIIFVINLAMESLLNILLVNIILTIYTYTSHIIGICECKSNKNAAMITAC